MTTPLVIALDGPSGSGKSSTSRGVATRLGLAYLDTGAMYRAVTWAVLERGVDPHDADAVEKVAAGVSIEPGTDPQRPTIAVDGTDVSEPIRSDAVNAAVSPVATVPGVRARMVELQRSIIAASDGIVVEGRDIASTVAPDAQVKVYLVADPAARAARRAAEEGHTDAEATKASLLARDAIDSTRETSPLVRADGAVEVDSTYLSLDEVVDRVVSMVP